MADQTAPRPLTAPKIALFAVLAIIAFAGNSLIARMALAGDTGETAIDPLIEPGAYSLIRLAAGALVLLPFIGGLPRKSDLPGGLALVFYVAGFSWAYVALGAAAGALILFGFVQVTVVTVGAIGGERPKALALLGMAIAMSGLAILFAPSVMAAASADAGQSAQTSSGLIPALLMAGAGIAWGLYTGFGRQSGAASAFTAKSFAIGTVLALPLIALDSGLPQVSGIGLALLSGAVTSGLGYVIWNKVSPSLGLATVAAVQLATPLVAALAAIPLLGEELSAQLLIAGACILGGIVLTLKR